MELLELRWREHIERAVAPAVVVERLDVFEDRVGELDPRLSSSAVEQLDLHPAPERLHHRVVEGGPGATDRRHQLRLLHALGEGPRPESPELNRSPQTVCSDVNLRVGGEDRGGHDLEDRAEREAVAVEARP